MNTNVKTISTFTNLEGTTTTEYRHTNFHNLSALVERHGNDMYGNPLYKVRIKGGDSELTYQFPQAYRRYRSKGYSLIQSYNIEHDVANILQSLQSFEFHGYTFVPYFKLNAFDELSFEFSVITKENTYYEDEQDTQGYDTFRIFDGGTVKGTMSTDYYVYDDVLLPVELFDHVQELYKEFVKFSKRVSLDDHTKAALENFEEDGWEN